MIGAGNDEEQIVAIAVGQMRASSRFQIVSQVMQGARFADLADYVPVPIRSQARKILTECAETGISVWPLTCPEYPAHLRHIADPPSALYISHRGGPLAISQSTIAVVGRRAATVHSCLIASALAQELADAGVTIVSGLALGIDGAAHRGALQSELSCPTVAVLAHGLDRTYPPSHAGLARQILAAGGALISEYPPGVQPMRHHFLARNRIIAGLSRGVVVMQAGARSGSLVTAQCAADYGRDVFVLETGGDLEERAGCEELLAQGAIAVQSAKDVLAEYGLLKRLLVVDVPGIAS